MDEVKEADAVEELVFDAASFGRYAGFNATEFAPTVKILFADGFDWIAGQPYAQSA